MSRPLSKVKSIECECLCLGDHGSQDDTKARTTTATRLPEPTDSQAKAKKGRGLQMGSEVLSICTFTFQRAAGETPHSSVGTG